MATKKAKTTKKVTEIDDAKVKIEVEEIEGKEAEEKVEDKSEDEVATEKSTNDADDTSNEPEGVDDKSADVASASTADDTEEQDEPEEEKEEDIIENFEDEGGRFSWKKVILFTLIAAFLGAIIVGGFTAYQKGYRLVWIVVDTDKGGSDKSIDIPDVTLEPTEAPVDPEAYDITILNGSGIEGEAATVQELLEEDGFTVAEIGNADNAAYLETEIRAAEDVDEEYLDALEESLETRGPVSIEEASSTQTEEVVVVVGSELADPDAEPTPILE